MDVTNPGKRAGDEVVQLYVKHLDSKVDRPIQELRGFRRVPLQPGERKTVEIPLQAKSLAYWDTAQHTFVVEAGKIGIRVGGSSAEIRLKQIVDVR